VLLLGPLKGLGDETNRRFVHDPLRFSRHPENTLADWRRSDIGEQPMAEDYNAVDVLR
jgi:hypothetical protein